MVTDRILVGVDGSAGSRRALLWAISEAKARDCIIDALAVWESPNAVGESLWTPPEEKRLADEALGRLSETIEEVAGADPGVEIHPVVLRGDPAQILCSWSNDAQLLVLGTRGHGGFVGLLLGSVSSKCAQHSSCPVVIVPRQWPQPPERPSDDR